MEMPRSTPSSHFSEMRLDSTDGSALHRLPHLLVLLGISKDFILSIIYLGTVCLTLLPLMIAGLYTWLTAGEPACKDQMSIFCDVGNIFLFVVSFPSILLLALTDQRNLDRALHTVQADGTVIISETDGKRIATVWFRRFSKANRAVYAIGLVAAFISAFIIFRGAIAEKDGGWIAHDGHFFLVGYIYLFDMVLFVTVLAIYVLRSFVIAILLRDIARQAELRLLPLHPDKAGGLEPMGRLGLRNQYALTILGINIALAVLTAHLFIPNKAMIESIGVATAFYLVVGPIVFAGPLLPFRNSMIRSRSRLMTGVALRMRVELENVQSRLQSGMITADDEQLIERLRKIGAIIDDLPIWPFDAATLRKFFAAYIIPILLSVGGATGAIVIKDILQHYFGMPV